MEDEESLEVIDIGVQERKVKDSLEEVTIKSNAKELDDISATEAGGPTKEVPIVAEAPTKETV